MLTTQTKKKITTITKNIYTSKWNSIGNNSSKLYSLSVSISRLISKTTTTTNDCVNFQKRKNLFVYHQITELEAYQMSFFDVILRAKCMLMLSNNLIVYEMIEVMTKSAGKSEKALNKMNDRIKTRVSLEIWYTKMLLYQSLSSFHSVKI